MKHKIQYANNVDVQCLVSGLGHDFVSISRPYGTTTEYWMECYQCGMTLGELEKLEENCTHDMICKKCAYPLMKNRDIKEELDDKLF